MFGREGFFQNKAKLSGLIFRLISSNENLPFLKQSLVHNAGLSEVCTDGFYRNTQVSNGSSLRERLEPQ